MEKIKLGFCSIGNPLDSKTWSGTPYNLLNALKKKCTVLPVDSGCIPNKFLKFFLKLISSIYYRQIKGLERGFFYRTYRSWRIKKIFGIEKEISCILHLSSLDMPFFKPDDKKHFLFCDSTWDLFSKYSHDSNYFSKRLRNDAEKLEKKCYEQCYHIFAISEFVKTNLIEHYKICADKITVVGTGRGGIKPFFGQKDYSNGKILFVAKERFGDKGGDLVLKAFKMAHKKISNLHLTIVGQSNNLNYKIDETNIRILGYIPLPDLQALYNESSLFLMPAFYEPWGLVYLEALSCKIPIVGLNRGSIPEITCNGKYGFILEEPDPKELANIIVYAFSNPDILKEKGEQGQKYCLKNFTWDKTVDKILNVILELEGK